MNIVVTSPSFSKNSALIEESKRFFENIKLNTNGTLFTKKELVEFIGDAEAAIVGLDKIDSEVLDSCKNLKIISKYGVGLDNLDLNECSMRNIKIGWTMGVNRLSVAEMTLAFMLMLNRNLYTTSNELKNGIWNKAGGFQLTGKTIGIIGIGSIGKELVRLLKPFKCKILVNDIVEQSSYYVKNNLIEKPRNQIFEESDIVTLHTCFDEDTRNMVDLEMMKRMKSSSFLINTSRSGIVNEDDLKYALQNKIIAGAAIDVYVEEPPQDKELLRLPNLICTPHIGGNSKEAVEAMGMSAIKHLKDFYKL
jgi:D-3-phosphoglycerate dehydrogenase